MDQEFRIHINQLNEELYQQESLNEAINKECQQLKSRLKEITKNGYQNKAKNVVCKSSTIIGSDQF